MSINICTHNTKGLLNDCIILKNKLKEKYVVNELICSEREIYTIKQEQFYEKQFFLEHIFPHLLQNSNCNVYIPNLEFLNEHDFKLMKTNHIHFVIAKNEYTYNYLCKVLGSKVLKWCWSSVDRNLDRIKPDFNQFLHLKGVSRLKNSQILLNLWMKHPNWPMLHLVHHGKCNVNGFLEIKTPFLVNNNITIYQYDLDEITLSSLMNRCGTHICPSETEGYGHYINEARSVGANVIIPNSEPMNEFTSKKYGFLIDVEEHQSFNLGKRCIISEEALEKTIQQCINKSWEVKLKQSKVGRHLYDLNCERFNSQSF